MALSVDFASFSDMTSLAQLYEELIGNKTDTQKMKEQFAWMESNPDYVVLVAKDGGSVFGSVLGVICHDLAGNCNPFMVVDNVIVKSSVRGKGIGRILMEMIEETAKKRMCNYIMLVSRSDREEAHRFYESIGYSIDVVRGFKKYL